MFNKPPTKEWYDNAVELEESHDIMQGLMARESAYQEALSRLTPKQLRKIKRKAKAFAKKHVPPIAMRIRELPIKMFFELMREELEKGAVEK